ncbi:hypothetical protein SOVF_018810 isoform A [Spinacia oleracea]|uniref:Uncharacterized protein isoform X2 n=1 Tax=Spinacia oleracea TaxID=3562 RepID=A0A9R0IUI4_SPIOL|nr:uncharacterized protein LOC110780166 isoform X2 [Spinacia oleracea]KNA24117.1 hypothetical protein SOVF_018810 isoform A [Spinacia oleracea]
MEAEQRKSALRSKRKPLSDCTNILQDRRKNPSSPSSAKIPKLQTLTKPPRPINTAANAVKTKQFNPNPNPSPSTCSSPKSHTSTGSNNSPEPPAPPTPLSDAGGIDCRKSRITADQIQRHDATTRKDKGKMVANDPIIQLSASLTSDSPQISSSAVPGHCSRSVIQSFPSQKLHAQTIKDKGKAIVDDPVNEFSVPWTSKYFHSSSSISSDGSLSETSAAYTRELHVETRKDKENMFLENPNFEASEPSTPRVPLAPLASSGTREKPVTVYNLRRAGQSRKHAAGNINEPVTCPPGQRIKKKGLELDYDRGRKNAGSYTDPLPMHKKKRSRDEAVHVMPKEEIEKLRAIYADIDAFELPEEVASESELE